MPRTLADVEKEVQEKYPDLRASKVDGTPCLKGSFPLIFDGKVLDRYSIEITFSQGFDRLPSVREIGGRIPKIRDRHINDDGTICAEVPEIVLLSGNYTIVSYLDGPVRNYFIGQSLVEQKAGWPFGQWSHGRKGLIEAYGSILGISDEAEIRLHLECLSHSVIRGHFLCPCGNGKKLRACHFKRIQDLRVRISPDIASQALKRLRNTK